MTDQIRAGFERDDRFDRQRRIEWIDQEKISRSSVLVLGAGALGNEVVKNLVLSGFHILTIVDFDRVERSNLARCVFFTERDAEKRAWKAECLARAIEDFSDEIKVSLFTNPVEELPRNVFAEQDIIFGCLDNFNARLHVNAYASLACKPYIDGGMQGTIGRIFLSKPPDGPCLECASNATHSKIAALRFSCTDSSVNFFAPPTPAEITTTSIVSALAVKEGMRLLSPKAPKLEGQMIYYDGLRNSLELMELDIDPSCPNHGSMRDRGSTE